MATSPIYGWLEPDNSDLVKNGALAIRTLGNAIDTTMATMTPKSIVDAKGDLIAASANDTPARLAVGNNGETLVADSSTSTGLRYNPLVAQNFVINGSLDNWQRGTTFTSPANGSYTADRWSAVFCSSVSRSTNVPTGFQYSLEFSGTSTTPNVNYRMESADATTINNQSVTFSIWAQGVTGSTALSAEIYTANAKDDFSGLTLLTTLSLSANPSTTWTRYTGTFTATSVSNGLQIRLVRASGTTTTRIAGVQLEVGSVMTTWKRAGGTIQGELAACQRYYEKSYAQATAPATATFAGAIDKYIGVTVTGSGDQIYYRVSKRTAPTVTIYSASTGTSARVWSNSLSADQTITGGANGESAYSFYWSQTSAGLNVSYHFVASAEL